MWVHYDSHSHTYIYILSPLIGLYAFPQHYFLLTQPGALLLTARLWSHKSGSQCSSLQISLSSCPSVLLQILHFPGLKAKRVSLYVRTVPRFQFLFQASQLYQFSQCYDNLIVYPHFKDGRPRLKEWNFQLALLGSSRASAGCGACPVLPCRTNLTE